jgi:pimeloyl-ACP methyl ester carboxylesterase
LTPTTDALLATLSAVAYSDTPIALPAGFTALDPSNFVMALQPGETFSDGIFRSGNGVAQLSVGNVEGLPTLVISFRGSDDAIDGQQDLNNINDAYASFGSLIAAVDAASAAWGTPVVATGHSLGGSLAQLYMANHPDQPGLPGHAAVTFGSGGAILPAGTDERVTNYVIADDPAVVLGAHRAEVGEVLRANPALADAAATKAAQELPGLTKEQALASLPNVTANYDNHGQIVLLPGRDGRLDSGADLANLSRLDFARHDVDLYVSEVAQAVATGQSVVIPETPSADPELHLLQAIYDGSNNDPAAGQSVTDQLLRSFGNGVTGGLVADVNGGFNDVRDMLGGIAGDQLFA